MRKEKQEQVRTPSTCSWKILNYRENKLPTCIQVRSLLQTYIGFVGLKYNRSVIYR